MSMPPSRASLFIETLCHPQSSLILRSLLYAHASHLRTPPLSQLAINASVILMYDRHSHSDSARRLIVWQGSHAERTALLDYPPL